MVTDCTRVLIKLMRDPRLVTAVAGAVGHFAKRSGFVAAAHQDLVAATEAACRDTFHLLPSADGTIDLAVGRYHDRVEVTISHCGEAIPTVGLDTFLQGAADVSPDGGLTGLALLARVDRVQYQTENGVSSMTLVKYLAGKQ